MSGPADTLRPAQRRRLQVVLGHMLALADDLRGIAGDPKVRGHQLQLPEDDLPPEFVRAAPDHADRLQAATTELIAWLELTPDTWSQRQRVVASCLHAAIDVEDSGSAGLRGYGPVDAQVAARLDPAIERLGQLLYKIAASAGRDLNNPEGV